MVAEMFFFARWADVIYGVFTSTNLAGVPVKVVFGTSGADMVLQVFFRTRRTRMVRQMFSCAVFILRSMFQGFLRDFVEALKIKVAFGQALWIAGAEHLWGMHLMRRDESIGHGLGGSQF